MTGRLLTLGIFVVISAVLTAQAPEPPIADLRLTVHTLLREDVFAAYLQNDLARLARAEKNIDLLLASRPADRPALLAWQGGTALTRAVVAGEARHPDEFREHYRLALDRFAEAIRLGGPTDIGVFAIIGAAQISLADRLPAVERAAGWEQAYSAFQQLWKIRGAAIERLPLHHKGELLAGLAQSAQRTGRNEAVTVQLDRMLALLPDTSYARGAQQWKDDPAARSRTKLACQTCHAQGTLAARLVEVSQ